MKMILSSQSLDDYRTFLAIKKLPRYRIKGCIAEFPDEYANLIGVKTTSFVDTVDYKPWRGLFDYQRDIARIALRKKKFAAFVDPGFGKTFIYAEFARYVSQRLGHTGRVLIVSPLMVIRQTMSEIERFYKGRIPMEQVHAADLNSWLADDGLKIGITNYEAITDSVERGRLGCLILDESSYLKSHYGKWGTRLIELGRGLEWKLAGTGTPAPNDRIEYANHAVFLDRFPTVNSFLARYFINRGQTAERWELKQHALGAFYRSLSDWCIFMTKPAVYGWKDNAGGMPPIHVHIHDVPMTDEQQYGSMKLTGGMFGEAGGFVQRGKLSRIAKGICHETGEAIPTHKFNYIVNLLKQWPDESTIIWCHYNSEQKTWEKLLPDAASIAGETPMEKRAELLDDFIAGRRKVMISKAKVLGFGLNLQIATRQVFSTLIDSYESYYQAVKRSNRVGSTRPLNVHLPVTDIERPMVANVLRKASRVQSDTEEQERMFLEHKAG